MAWPNPTPSDPSLCVLYGFIRDASGNGLPNVSVQILPPKYRAEQGRTTVSGSLAGEQLADYTIEVVTDANGYWEVELRRGMFVRVYIPLTKTDVENQVPNQDNQDFAYWSYQPVIEDSKEYIEDPVNSPDDAIIYLMIKVDSAHLPIVMRMFDGIEVFESTTRNGTYTKVGDTIILEDTKVYYEFERGVVESGRWYKARFVDSVTGEAGPLSQPLRAAAPDYAIIMTVGELKENYLFGIDLTDDFGRPYSKGMFEKDIRAAIDWLEKEVDIWLKPTARVEVQDYYPQDFYNFEFIQLDYRPVLAVDSVEHRIGDQTIYEIPSSWFVLDKETGQLRIVPQHGSLDQVLMTASGRYVGPAVFLTGQWPGYIRVTYRSGFEKGNVPPLVKEIIGKKAALGALNIAGDLLLGAGIASVTMGMDGVHQSINTTSSATNAGYGARIIQYRKEIKEDLARLRRYYTGIRMIIS